MAATWEGLAARVDELDGDATLLERQIDGLDVLPALESLRRIRDHLIDISGELVELAGAETKLTQRQMEEALDVPRGTLRGLRRGRVL